MAYADRNLRPPGTFTAAEVRALLKTSGEAKRGFRDHTIVSVALGMGLRESEIVALDVADVLRPDGKIRRRVQLRVFKHAGNGVSPADQIANVPDGTYYKLTKYVAGLRRLRQLSLAGFGSQPLFMSSRGLRLSTRQVRTMFRKLQVRAGIDQPKGFHSLRHTAITNVRKRSTIKHAQRFARHASIKTTARYDHVSDDELAAAVKDQPS